MYWRQVVSQSPTDTSAGSALTRYRQGWTALNRLLHTGRSFSGHERNCAFLNLGSGDFATVSSVSGLDFPDDGRAIATCDWDFDGRQDLWITNRTGPRLRLMRNTSAGGGRFLAVRLQGVTCNRDAIGARVEVVLGALESGAPQPKLIRTRYAGDGFLSQSSGWMHFGLGDRTDIDRLIVSWPGGEREEFRGASSDTFCILRQGTGHAARWEPPASRIPLTPAAAEIPRGTAVARIVLPFRLPLPLLKVDPQAAVLRRERALQADGVLTIDGPAIVNLWSSSCATCRVELADWAKHEKSFAQLGLEVIALSTDTERSDSARRLMETLSFPFAWAVAKPGTIRSLDLFQRAMLDLWDPLRLPSSFLLDGQGEVVAIYKGPIDLDQIARDVRLINASPEELRDAGTPFAGRWIAEVPVADPLRVSSQMVDHGHVSDAIEYLEEFVRRAQETNPGRLADVHYVLAVLLESQQRKDRALDVLRAASRLSPDDVRVRRNLGRLLGEAGRLEEAGVELEAAVRIHPEDTETRRQLAFTLIQTGRARDATGHLDALLARDPKDAATHFLMANCRRQIGEWAAAIEHYRTALEIDPGSLLAANNLAYILAAHPDRSFRDENEALRVAEAACRQTGFQDPRFLDTLAVAYAAAGQFDKAIATARQAIRLYENDPAGAASVEKVKSRILLFAQRTPLREDWD